MTHANDPTPSAPTYADIGTVARLLDGVPARHVREMMNAVYDRAGSAGTAIDWSSPDGWIAELLAGELRDLASRVWEGSGRTINPRYLYGLYVFINRLKLLEPTDGILRLGDRGRRFLAGDDAILRELVALRSLQRRPTHPRAEDSPRR
jgi:restriction system protein